MICWCFESLLEHLSLSLEGHLEICLDTCFLFKIFDVSDPIIHLFNQMIITNTVLKIEQNYHQIHIFNIVYYFQINVCAGLHSKGQPSLSG